MKRIIIITSIFIIFFYSLFFHLNIFTPTVLLGETDTITLKVAGDRNFPPYEYLDEYGYYIGFNVDIIRAAALATGINVQFYPMEWQEATESLQQGKVDVIQGIKMTKEREAYYDFSDAYLENYQSIFVSMESEIEKFEDLGGHRVAIQQGDVAIADLQTLKSVDIVFTKDQEEAMRKLAVGEVDAYIGNTLTGVFLTNEISIRNQVKIVGETLNPSKYAVAVRKGDASTLHILNKGLKEIKHNGTYDKIYRKWFGHPIQLPSWHKKKLLIVGAVAVSLLLIAIFSLHRWNTSLKKEVEKQTHQIQKVNKILIEQNRNIEKEKDFREKILQNIFIGVITMDGKGIISFANQLASLILKIENEKLIGLSYKETFLGQLFSLDAFQDKKGEGEVWIHGEKRLLDYDVGRIFTTDGKVEKFILLFRDITEERRMQESIKTKDKLQSLGNMVTAIAHEIRNPLTAIKTYAELLPRKMDNPEFQRMFSKDIPCEIDRINDLIKDLLEYARPRKPFREKIHLFTAINSVLALLKNKIIAENIIIENHIEDDIYVDMDKNHFKQIFLNLLLNAIESMDKSEKRITCFTKNTKKKVYLYIQDNGCGMDEEVMEKIYNPFYTTKSDGTGLGLFVCFQLLTENGVTLRQESIKGKGTTFIMEFTGQGVEEVAETVNC